MGKPHATDRIVTDTAGLYVHIPFCLRKCPYCDFFSIVADPQRQTDFLNALIKEIGLRGDTAIGFGFDSLYIGGGTPSVLSFGEMARVQECLQNHFKFSQDAEITVEANPGTIDAAKLKGYRALGINRINIGVQSFDDQNLAFLGRIHNAHQALEAVATARAAGFANLGIDLIYGLPDQSQRGWLRDLKKAVSLEPEHISSYILTLEKNTPMGEDFSKGGFTPLAEGETARLFETTLQFLGENDYTQYEISNFARSSTADQRSGRDHRSRHNRKYWNHTPYLGLGPSAHSFLRPRRLWNHPSMAAYIASLNTAKLPIAGEESLTPGQALMEGIYLGLRQTRGIRIEDFNRNFGIDFEKTFSALLEELASQKMLQHTSASCRLTVKGQRLLDSVVGRFVEKI
jgi:oxygen-independent coproporphyrinogen-3 oxidase